MSRGTFAITPYSSAFNQAEKDDYVNNLPTPAIGTNRMRNGVSVCYDYHAYTESRPQSDIKPITNRKKATTRK